MLENKKDNMSGGSLKEQGASLLDTTYANLPQYTPDSVKFKPIKQALPGRRVPIRIRPEQNLYASNNNRLVRFPIPNSYLLDTRYGYITFNCTVTVTGGTFLQIAQGIFSIFNRLRIIQGSTAIEDILDWNRIYAALWEMTVPFLVTSAIANPAMGFGTQLQRQAQTNNYFFVLPLFSGVLNTELLPLQNINNGLWLELYIEDPTKCIETDGATPIITVTSLLFHVERLELDPSYMAFIRSFVASNGLTLGFHTWTRYVNVLATSSRQDIQINHRSSSLNGILNFFINSATLNTTTSLDKFLNWIQLTETQTQLFINQVIFPDEPIDVSYANAIEGYQAYCRWEKKWKLNGFLDIAPVISIQAFNNNRFVQIDDLEPYPEEDDLVNPFTTLTNNATIIKRLFFSGSITANYQLDSWIEWFQVITIKQNGVVDVQR